MQILHIHCICRTLWVHIDKVRHNRWRIFHWALLHNHKNQLKLDLVLHKFRIYQISWNSFDKLRHSRVWPHTNHCSQSNQMGNSGIGHQIWPVDGEVVSRRHHSQCKQQSYSAHCKLHKHQVFSHHMAHRSNPRMRFCRCKLRICRVLLYPWEHQGNQHMSCCPLHKHRMHQLPCVHTIEVLGHIQRMLSRQYQ